MAALGPVTYLTGWGGTVEVRCDLSQHNSSLWSDWGVNSRVEGGGADTLNTADA